MIITQLILRDAQKSSRDTKYFNFLTIQLDENLFHSLLKPKLVFQNPFFATFDNPSYAHITSSIQNLFQCTLSIDTLISSLISEFTSVVKPYFSLLTTMINKNQWLSLLAVRVSHVVYEYLIVKLYVLRILTLMFLYNFWSLYIGYFICRDL